MSAILQRRGTSCISYKDKQALPSGTPVAKSRMQRSTAPRRSCSTMCNATATLTRRSSSTWKRGCVRSPSSHQPCQQRRHVKMAADETAAGQTEAAVAAPQVADKAPSAQAEDAAIATLRKAAREPGSVPPPVVLSAILALEKAKLQPDAWGAVISEPSKRWRLIYTAGSKDVAAAAKGQRAGGGYYVPLVAVQKYDAQEASCENGVFLGPVASLTFKGPYIFVKRQLTFGVNTMYVGIGPWRLPIKLGGLESLKDAPKEEVKKAPFFIFSWADDEIMAARGRGGGLALWANVGSDSEWQAAAGVLQVG